MTYTIRPLYSLEDHKHYFSSRYSLNKQFFPQEDAYYQNTYELDYYDSFSYHYGLFRPEVEVPVGFLRITPNLLSADKLVTRQAPELRDFISDALEEMRLPSPDSALPSLQQLENTFADLHERLTDKKDIAELGRLLISENSSSPHSILSLISFALAASIFQGITYMLIRTNKKHAQFYHTYFSSLYMAEPKEGEVFVPSIYKLTALSAKSMEMISDILQLFEEEKQVIPITFVKNRVHGMAISHP